MTTVIGINAQKGNKNQRGILMGSDITLTSTRWNEQGDIAIREQTQKPYDKLYISRRKDFVIGVTGIIDETYYQFFNKLLKGKYDLRKAIGKKDFEEFRDMNLSRMGGRDLNNSLVNRLLLATRFDGETMLHNIYPLGLVEATEGNVIGSEQKYAAEHINRYLESKRKSVPNITMSMAIDAAAGGLEAASTDIYSSGFDMVMVYPDSIEPKGKLINKIMAGAKKNIIRQIKYENSQR